MYYFKKEENYLNSKTTRIKYYFRGDDRTDNLVITGLHNLGGPVFIQKVESVGQLHPTELTALAYLLVGIKEQGMDYFTKKLNDFRKKGLEATMEKARKEQEWKWDDLWGRTNT